MSSMDLSDTYGPWQAAQEDTKLLHNNNIDQTKSRSGLVGAQIVYVERQSLDEGPSSKLGVGYIGR